MWVSCWAILGTNLERRGWGRTSPLQPGAQRIPQQLRSRGSEELLGVPAKRRHRGQDKVPQP